MEARDYETGILDVTLELDPKIDILSLQVVLWDGLKANNGNWKCTSVFSTIVTCRGKSYVRYIDSGSAINGVSQELVD